MRFVLLLFLLFGCEERPSSVDNLALLEMAREVESDIELVVPKSFDHVLVDCKGYTPSCSAGYKVKVRGITVVALHYLTFEDAYRAARRINAYWFRNWVFDDVKGEPVLERFVIKAFDAKLAREMDFPYPPE